MTGERLAKAGAIQLRAEQRVVSVTAQMPRDGAAFGRKRPVTSRLVRSGRQLRVGLRLPLVRMQRGTTYKASFASALAATSLRRCP